MTTTKRFLMQDGQRDDIDIALEYVRRLAQASAIDELVILIPVKENLNRTSLAEVLGEPNAKALLKGERISIANTSTHLETARSFRHAGPNAGVLVVYGDKALMDKVDESPGVAFVVAVPGYAGELERWRETWQVSVHGAAEEPQKSQIKDPVVERAISEVVNSFNKTHGTLSASYRDHANRVLRTLRYLGHHSEDPKNIRAWAVAHGWRPGAADELEALAQRVFGMKTKPSGIDREQLERDKSRWIGE